MQYEGIIVRFGELFLKGKNKFTFINKLFKTIKHKLQEFEELEYFKTNDHVKILLHGADHEEVIVKLDQIFGIFNYSLGIFCDSTMEAIKEHALIIAKDVENEETLFRIDTKRSYKKFPIASMDVSKEVGRYIGENSAIKMDIRKATGKLKITIKEDQTFITAKEIPALGGLPIGINGKTLLMLSGGLDSPVAGYLMMKRGLAVEGLHFESPPHTSVSAKQKVFDLAEKMAAFMPDEKIKIRVVPFTNLQKAIFAKVPPSYGMTVMRRMMYRVAAGLAEKYKIPLLSNGESLGQVASQTPQSMEAINAVTNMPVIRPVACMDKVEIMDLARKIDTYDISIRPFEDCCTIFVPKNPAISPSAKKCEEYEARFDWQPLVDECVENTTTEVIEYGNPVVFDQETTEEICSLL